MFNLEFKLKIPNLRNPVFLRHFAYYNALKRKGEHREKILVGQKKKKLVKKVGR